MTAFYVGPRAVSRKAEQVSDIAIEAVEKCFIENKIRRRDLKLKIEFIHSRWLILKKI